MGEVPDAYESRLRGIIDADPRRRSALKAVRGLRLPDCWIGAGFIRTAVWDSLLDRPSARPCDVDVVWFDSRRACPLRDAVLQTRLSRSMPELDWSLKNQSRMHQRNGDDAYTSSFDAVKRWPETATAVALRPAVRRQGLAAQVAISARGRACRIMRKAACPWFSRLEIFSRKGRSSFPMDRAACTFACGLRPPSVHDRGLPLRS